MKTPRFEAGEITIRIKGQTNRIPVPGFRMVNGFFGIHAFVTGVGAESKFVVTHLPSGYKMPGGPWTDVRLAAKFVELASEMEEVDWSLPFLRLNSEQRAEITLIMGRTTE